MSLFLTNSGASLVLANGGVPTTSSSVIASSRSIAWAAGVSGGIPTRSTVYQTLTTSNTLSEINAAIAACPSGQVVALAPGTYNLPGALVIARSDVTVRGAGPNATFLVFTSQGGLMHSCSVALGDGYGPYVLSPARSANWTAGYAKGTTSITLSATTDLHVGDVLILDQLDDSDTDTGTLWVNSTEGVTSTQGDANIRRPNRSQSQVVTVTTVNETTVTFTPGLYASNWTDVKSPGAWWGQHASLSGLGLENMSLDYTSATGQCGVQVNGCRDWWVKNCRHVKGDRCNIWVFGTGRGEIRDSYFFGTHGTEDGSQSYGIETDICSDLLVENNIFQEIAAPMVTGESASGCVYGYNYAIHDRYPQVESGWMQACCYQHSSGLFFHLFEGNDGPGFNADAIHGTSNFVTLFRNHFVGWEPDKTMQTVPIQISAFNRNFNILGNVLGRSLTHSAYEGYPTSGSQSGPDANVNVAIYMLGWSGNQAKASNVLNDTLVRSTVFRWGNYDIINDVARWESSEVPSALASYAQPVPSSETLPSSLYLAAKPSWFGAIAWPPIGPDVSGGDVSDSGSKAYRIPARVMFEDTMGGTYTSGLLAFVGY